VLWIGLTLIAIIAEIPHPFTELPIQFDRLALTSAHRMNPPH
jgi:hypothetical protein